MRQEEEYIAVVSEQLSKPGDTRYVIINRQTREVVDNGMGRGYKSPQAAHKSFAFKQRRRQRGQAARQTRQQAQSPVVHPRPLRIQSASRKNNTPPSTDLFDPYEPEADGKF